MIIQISTGQAVATVLACIVVVAVGAYSFYSAGKNNRKNAIVLRENAIKGKYRIERFVTIIDERFVYIAEREDYRMIFLSSKEEINTSFIIIV